MVRVDAEGRLVLPPDVATRLGLQPGAAVMIEEGDHVLRLFRSVSNLAKVYVEPTNACNLDCITCMRQVWDEPLGQMSAPTYGRIVEGLKAFSPVPTVFFGGLGEPLAHPRIVEMIRQAKTAGAKVELITNGILLNEAVALQLIQADLDVLWVSLDGATPESYSDVRLGATLPRVIENLRRLPYLRYRGSRLKTVMPLGIAFVAMKRNVAELPAVLQLGTRLGAKWFSVTNVLAHTEALKGEILYHRTMVDGPRQLAGERPRVSFPRMDMTEATQLPLAEMLRGNYTVQTAGGEAGRGVYTCPFVEKGTVSIRWDGQVSPCLPLLHTHEAYLHDRVRRSHAYFVGQLGERSLPNLWHDPAYLVLRERLAVFDYSPCVDCNCCDLTEENREDCLSNSFPACGGCLWAQGIVQCP
jgi:MoaA/NifB/PqqE/SkfB family radical SAM enzyme